MYSEKGHCNYLEIEKIEKKKRLEFSSGMITIEGE